MLVAFFAKAFADAEPKQGKKKGERYAALLATVDNSDDDNESTLIVRVLAKGAWLDEALGIEKGSHFYCEGNAAIGLWNGPKGTRPSVAVKANFLRKTRFGEEREVHKLEPAAEYVAAALSRPRSNEMPAFVLRKTNVKADEGNGACPEKKDARI